MGKIRTNDLVLWLFTALIGGMAICHASSMSKALTIGRGKPHNPTKLAPTASVIRVPQDYSTIQEAVDAAQDYDMIILSQGTYQLSETIFVDKPITLTSEYINSNDESDINATVITSDVNLDPLVLFDKNASDSKCIGLTFRDAHKQLTTESEYIEVTNCSFYDNGSDALSIEAGGGYFAHNYFENNGDEAIDADDSLSWVAEYNTIVNPGDDGFEIRLHNNDGSERLHVIRYNYISGADEDGIQLIDYDGDSGREFQIHHNIIRNSAMVGLGCTSNGNTVENFEGSYMEEETFVYNNVFDNNDHSITGANKMLVFNNIILNSTTAAIKKLDNDSSSDYNCLFNNGTDFINALTGTNNILENPLLKLDYSLEEESPCIEAGIKTYAVNGLGQTVDDKDILGEFPDIGAKEFAQDLPVENIAPSVSLAENQVLLHPNNTLLLSGLVSDDGLPENSDIMVQWTLESGPEGEDVIFTDANSAETEVTFDVQGVYELKLTATDGEKTSSDKITVFFVNDFNDSVIEVSESLFIEAEDYRYLVGSAQVMSVEGSSAGQIVNAPIDEGAYAYSEHRLVTFTEGTYYVWVNATRLDGMGNSLKIAFNDLERELQVETLTTNSFGGESWVKVVFGNIPEGVYPLRIAANKEGVAWDRIFITTNENEAPFNTEPEVLNIYPVPNTGQFTIALKNTEPTKIKVFDIQGRLVFKTSVSDTFFALVDIPIIDKGMYVVSIENDTEMTTKKIVIN
ncbi:T9SS type A sorting domain-containing protein [Flagellimonas sp.]|uniref:T9SS type A sorting domain-containing protein n=1 Tax=Flagellimonas sp. TaxID=2058762 RepID=UPI003B5B0936